MAAGRLLWVPFFVYRKGIRLISSTVFRAIIGMAHPPHEQPTPPAEGEVKDEVLPPPYEQLNMSDDYVHFDLDPTNGKPDEPESVVEVGTGKH